MKNQKEKNENQTYIQGNSNPLFTCALHELFASLTCLIIILDKTETNPNHWVNWIQLHIIII